MAVSLPTSTDVRKVRETAAERAEVARTPLLAALGAGDYAVSGVVGVVQTARTRAVERAEDVQQRVGELPRTPAELRKQARELREELRERAEDTYVGLAERGAKAWGRIRKQPQVKQAISTIEGYTEKLDARVDGFVDDAHEVAEKALATVTRQTRSTGEKVAQGTQRAASEVAETVAGAGKDASAGVADAAKNTAKAIDEAGDDAASTTRSVSRKAANRAAPKPATRRRTTS